MSTMLHVAANTSFNTIMHRQPTYKVPNFMFAYYLIGLMDVQMATTKKFTEANNDWLPFVSHLYFAILFFYVTLQRQKLAADISDDQQRFLEYIDDYFNGNIGHALIPGPIVHIFQALASGSGPNERYGNLTFAIPNNLGYTQANEHRYSNRLGMHLPNVPFILDQFMNTVRVLSQGMDNNVVASATDSWYTSIFGQDANAAASMRVHMLSPSARARISVPSGVLSSFRQAMSVWHDSLPFTATGTSVYTTGTSLREFSFAQLLGFTSPPYATTIRNHGWPMHVFRVMQGYSAYWKDSCSLGKISSLSIGANFITVNPTSEAETVAALLGEVTTRSVRYQGAGGTSVRYEIKEISDVWMTFSSTEYDLDLVAYQLGMVSGLDWNWQNANNSTAAVYSGPARGAIVVGPISNRSEKSQTTENQLLRSFGVEVAGYYHTTNALPLM
jgi:hypothetical protein